MSAVTVRPIRSEFSDDWRVYLYVLLEALTVVAVAEDVFLKLLLRHLGAGAGCTSTGGSSGRQHSPEGWRLDWGG